MFGAANRAQADNIYYAGILTVVPGIMARGFGGARDDHRNRAQLWRCGAEKLMFAPQWHTLWI